MEHNDLKHYGYLFKTDKIINHGYHRFYHKELVEYKHKTMGMIEIGIENFKSVDMWKHYFPKSFIYGIDLNINYQDPRIKIIKTDPSKLSELESLKTIITHPIYFINDNGRQLPRNQIITFNYLFSNVLKDGGTYIIDDIEVSYWKKGNINGTITECGYSHPESIIEKFKLVLDYVNTFCISDETKEILHEKTSFLSKETKDKILSITFGQNCIIIKKKGINDMHYHKPPYNYNDFIN
jgi:hypothetical protein